MKGSRVKFGIPVEWGGCQSHLDRQLASFEISQLAEGSLGEVDVLAPLLAASTSVDYADENALG